jgi:uncharacterized membrane protein YdjX (TVP38/TMEM64 family)
MKMQHLLNMSEPFPPPGLTGQPAFPGLDFRFMIRISSQIRAGRARAGWKRLLYVVRRLGFVAPLALLTTGLPVIGGLLILASLLTLGETVRGLESWGPWVFIGGAALLGGLSLLPTHGLSLLGGYVFGFKEGVLLTLTAIVCGAGLAYYLKGLISRERVMGLISEKPESLAVHRALVSESFSRSFLMVVLIRLSPAAPFAVTNLFMASTSVNWRPFLLGTAVGMLPRCAAVVNVGALWGQLGAQAETTAPVWLIVAGIAATVLALALIGMWSRRALLSISLGERSLPVGQA